MVERLRIPELCITELGNWFVNIELHDGFKSLSFNDFFGEKTIDMNNSAFYINNETRGEIALYNVGNLYHSAGPNNVRKLNYTTPFTQNILNNIVITHKNSTIISAITEPLAKKIHNFRKDGTYVQT